MGGGWEIGIDGGRWKEKDGGWRIEGWGWKRVGGGGWKMEDGVITKIEQQPQLIFTSQQQPKIKQARLGTITIFKENSYSCYCSLLLICFS